MATQKFVLDIRRQRQDGRYPVIQRIYVSTRYYSRATGIVLKKSDWDIRKQKVKSSNNLCKQLNEWIEEIRLEVQSLFLQFKFNPTDISQISAALKGETEQSKSFLKFGNMIIDDLLVSGRIGNARAYRDAINKLSSYVLSDEISFDDINYQFLYEFEKHLLANGLKINSVASYMRSIRAIYNLGIKHGIAHDKNYPFKLYRIKTEATINKTLSVAELKLLYKNFLNHNSNDIYLTTFFICFSLIGISFMDLIFSTWDNIQEGRLIYKRRKTGKIYNILIPSIALKVLNNLKNKTNRNFLLPIINSYYSTDLDQYKAAKNQIGYCNRRLKQVAKSVGIQKPITTYYARYSWANIAKELGISKDIISEALGHEYGNRITGIYLDQYRLEKIDAANKLIHDTVFLAYY